MKRKNNKRGKEVEAPIRYGRFMRNASELEKEHWKEARHVRGSHFRPFQAFKHAYIV